MKIKTGDKVKILAGKDKGKTGKVLQVFPLKGRVSVEGINLTIKNQRPKKQGEKGQRIQYPAPLNLSNVALICPKCNKSARVGFQIIMPTDKQKGKKVKERVCKKCKETI